MNKIVATNGKYRLEHTILEEAGDYGQDVEMFEVTWIETEGKDKGMMFKAPVHPPIRLTDSRLFIQPLKPYTQEEYNSLLNKFTEQNETTNM